MLASQIASGEKSGETDTQILSGEKLSTIEKCRFRIMKASAFTLSLHNFTFPDLDRPKHFKP